MKRHVLLAVTAIAAVVISVVFLIRRERRSDAEPVSIGSYSDVVSEIRGGLRRQRTRCELGPPDMTGAPEFEHPERPHRELPLSELVGRSDVEVVYEMLARAEDEYVEHGLGGMTTGAQAFHLFAVLEGEVSNGGFHQYFSNSSGNCAARTLTALRLVGGNIGSLYDRAVAKFPNATVDEDRATRNERMESIPDEFGAWSSIDHEFYSLEWTSTFARFVRDRAALFERTFP